MNIASESGKQMNRLDEALDACLEGLARGESLEHCLAQYPGYRQQLEPLMALAAGLQAIQSEPVPAPPQRAKRRVLREAARLRQEQARPTPRFRLPQWHSLPQLMRRSVVVTLAASLLLVAVLGTGAAAVSANSLPGDALYPVKRMTEEVRLLLAIDQDVRAELQAELEERRRDEALAIAEIRRVAEMSFTGVLDRIQDGHWTVSGVTVDVSDRKQVEGDIEVGTPVRVQVRSLSDGTLLALSISTQPQPAAPATATPTPPPTPSPTHTPLPTEPPPTAAAIPPQPSRPPPPTVRPQASVTPPPTLTPTATATPVPPTPEPPRLVKVRFSGRIESIASHAWTIDGQLVRLDSNTKIGPSGISPVVGAMTTVVAVRTEDGGLLALEISVEAPAQPTDQPFEFQGLIESYAPTEWVVGGRRLRISTQTQVSGVPMVGLLAQVKAVKRGDGSLWATSIQVLLPSETVQFEGLLQSLSAEVWVVEGVNVRLDAQTQIAGFPALGAVVEVEGVLLPDDSVLARLIRVRPPPTATPTLAPAGQSLPTATPAWTADSSGGDTSEGKDVQVQSGGPSVAGIVRPVVEQPVALSEDRLCH